MLDLDRMRQRFAPAHRQYPAPWQVVSEFENEQRRALLKFATSCSRAPLGGFKHLVPPLCIHKVSDMMHNALACA